MNARFQADPSLIRQRRCASEHPFGTIKRMTAGGQSSLEASRKSAGRQHSACSPKISSARLISSGPPPSARGSLEPSKKGSG